MTIKGDPSSNSASFIELQLLPKKNTDKPTETQKKIYRLNY